MHEQDHSARLKNAPASSKVSELPISRIQGEPLENPPPLSDFISLPRTSSRLGLPVEARMSRAAWPKVMDEVPTEAEAFGIKQTHLEHVVRVAHACISRIIPGREHTFVPGYCDGQKLYLRGWISDGILFIDESPEFNAHNSL